MFTHQSPAMPSTISLPSLSVSVTPLARVMTRTPFFATEALALNGCM
jgi:hypothetical protein